MPLCISVRLRRNYLVSDKLKAFPKSNNPKVDQGNPGLQDLPLEGAE